MSRFDQLSITGFQKQPIANRFIRQDQPTNRLGIIFPGYNYSPDLPLLYYTAGVLEMTRADVLLIDTLYSTRPGVAELDAAEQDQLLREDATASLSAALAVGTYEHITLVGKSVGTRALSRVLPEAAAFGTSRAVWLTPLVRNDGLRASILEHPIPSLFVVGTADRTYDPALLDPLVNATAGQCLVIDGADHGLEIPGDIRASLAVLVEYVTALEHFLQA